MPNAHYFGQEGLHNVLVIDLLGPSLEDMFDVCGRRFSVKTVAMLAISMVKNGFLKKTTLEVLDMSLIIDYPLTSNPRERYDLP